MTIKIYFRYYRESSSFYNKMVRIAMIVLGILGFAGWCASPAHDPVLGIIFIISYALAITIIGIHTNKIKKEYKYFEENGMRCNGRIIDVISEEGAYDMEKHSSTIILYLLVEYIHPVTGEAVQFQTGRVNSSPYIYLSSLDVTVYVLPDKRALATDFKRIKHLKDSVSHQMRQQENRK